MEAWDLITHGLMESMEKLQNKSIKTVEIKCKPAKVLRMVQ